MKTIRQSDIKSGDILAWAHNPNSFYSDLVLATIRTLTNSAFGHVAVAWKCQDRFEDELFCIEATMPRIRAYRCTDEAEYFVVPMKNEMTKSGKEFLMSKIGLSYSVSDAIRGGLGLTVQHDDKYQCAELIYEYLAMEGIVLNCQKIPKKIIAACEAYSGTQVYRVIKG